jgi:hypothetical protein
LEHSLACPKHPSPALPSTSGSTSSSEETTFDGVPSLTKSSKSEQECEAVPSWSYIPPPKGKEELEPAYLTIPSQDSIRQEPAVAFPETREALDVTAKFFYLPPSDYSQSSSSSSSSIYDSLDPAWINESLEQLAIATGLTEVDTFIISFPGLTFDDRTTDDCCDDSNARTNNGSNGTGAIMQDQDKSIVKKNILKIWKEASKNTHLSSLGVSEFSLDRLRWLLNEGKNESTNVNANAGADASSSGDTTKQATNSHTGRAGTTGITSTRFRKPRVCQVNTRNRCDVPSEMVQYAKEEDVDLLVHSDCSGGSPFLFLAFMAQNTRNTSN